MAFKLKPKTLFLNGKTLTVDKISSFLSTKGLKIEFESAVLNTVAASHAFLIQALKEDSTIIYGINTGFGPMANYILAKGQLLDLQKNLILSHAVGMGEKISDDFVLAAMIIRLNALAKGHSGVSLELLEQLKIFINLRIIPLVPEHGAVGTSGDLVQLAHIALGLLGKGEANFKNKTQKVSTILKQTGIKPYRLKPKEGLSLINGTAMMSGIAALICEQSRQLLSLAIRSGCLAMEIIKAYDDSLSPTLHNLRPHKGQIIIAETARKILRGSKLIRARKTLNQHANHGSEVSLINESVQEIYSLRCLAQILGPAYESLAKAWQTTETEMNSVTDNPIIDWTKKEFLHGGNFHGDYIAVNMDQLKMSLVKLTMLSERRLNFFLNHKINQLFPPFLNLDTPGLTLGLQGLQFVATSTTANSQTLAYPMNLHSISTNGDNQDVVSMGADAALIASKVADNAQIVVAIELFALCQAVDYLKIQNKLSRESKNLYSFVREHVKTLKEDRELHPDLQNLVAALKSWPEANLFEKF